MRISSYFLRPPLFTFLLLCCLLAVTKSALAQEQKPIKGIVADSIDKAPLQNCTVVFQLKNGAVQKATTTEKGVFTFTAKADSALIIIKHDGYTELRLPILITEKQGSFDTIFLPPLNRVMEDIVIKAKVPPIVIREDTTEFNIDSTMFDPYDAVEDLVKRLPGLEIDAEGKMSFHGKPITRILVDGEDLFGGDPTFSMKKIPAGMVAKIQVMDTKTLEELFNRMPTDGEDKTLNIKLKSGVKTFGAADAMAGTKSQLEANSSWSLFEAEKHVSVVGSFNSSNKLGVTKIGTGPTSSSTNAGVNYGNKWGDVSVNGSYGYTQGSNSTQLYRERTQNITADSSFFTRSNSFYNYSNTGHRFSIGTNWVIDSTSTLDLGLSINNNKSNSKNSGVSTTTENGALRNESINSSTSAGDYKTLGATLFWAKRLNRKGRVLTVNAKANNSDQTSNLYTISTNTYFKNGVPVTGDTLDRNTKTISAIRNYAVNISYTEPISKKLRVNLRGDLDFNKTATSKSIYNLDSVSHTAEYDSLYSARIRSYYNTQNFTALLLYTTDKWNVTTGLTTVLQQTRRTLQGEQINQTLLRYSPSANVTYILSKGETLRANFAATTIQPTIDQLQPVPDNSNPLYIRLGNPNLRTAFSQNFGLNYNYYSVPKMVVAGLAYLPVTNQIINAVFYDEFRKQTSRFINVAGVYSLRGNFSITTTARQDKQSQSWSFSSNGNYGQQVFFQNNNQYYSRNYTAGGQLSFSRREAVAKPTSYSIGLSSSFNRNWTPANTGILNTTRLIIAPKLEGSCTLAAILYATLFYQVGYNKINYHSAVRGTNEYSSHLVASNLTLQVKRRYSMEAAFAYTYNTQVPAGANKALPNLNLYVSAYVFKGGKGQVKLEALNLFATANDLRRTVGENYIEDLQVTSLRNYFTLRFQYNFSSIKKEKGVKK